MLTEKLLSNIQRQITRHIAKADWSRAWWNQLSNLAETEARLLTVR